jgi:hypothetical protein
MVFWVITVGPTRCPETSVNNYHTTPCNHQKDHRLNITVFLVDVQEDFCCMSILIYQILRSHVSAEGNLQSRHRKHIKSHETMHVQIVMNELGATPLFTQVL